MTITAKYASTCPICGRAIRPGDQVEWERGSKARHAHCAGSRAPNAPAARNSSQRKPPRKPAPRTRRTPKEGEQLIQRRGDAYVVGATIHASKISGGGGPDGCYWTVTSAWRQRANEDMGYYDDMECALVRAATDDEVAPIRARLAASDARKTCEEWLAKSLDRGESISDTGHLPPADQTEISLVLGRKTGYSGTITDGGTTYAVTATTVVAHHGGYYDDYRSVTRTVARTDELVQVIRALVSNDADGLLVCADRIKQVQS